MKRLLGSITAIMFTATTVTGIAALIAQNFTDLTPALSWAKDLISPHPKVIQLLKDGDPLKNADGITFFKSVPIEGTKLKVTTGIAFASTQDVTAGKTKSRWCYIQVSTGNFSKKFDLGSQIGIKNPTYTDSTRFSAKQLRDLGLSAEKLAKLARTHCLLNGFDPRKKLSKLKSTPKPKTGFRNKPPKVWNWKKPNLWGKHTHREQAA